MGNDTSRIWSVFELIDVNHDGRLSQAELEDWFKDEQFVGNPLFDQSINGFQSLPDLAKRFIKHVRSKPHLDGQLSPSSHSESLSFEDLRAYCGGMTDKDIGHLTMSLNPTKARRDFAIKQVFEALDVNRNGYLDAPEVEVLLNHLDPGHTLPAESREKLKSDLIAHESRKVVFSDLQRFFEEWPLREIRTRTEKLREHAKFIRQHSNQTNFRGNRKKNKALESIDSTLITGDQAALQECVNETQLEIDGLVETCLRLHTESININAAKRSINEDSRQVDQLLLKLDRERLVQANKLTEIQMELTNLHKQQLEYSSRRSVFESRVEELNKKIGPLTESSGKVARDNELVKEEMKRLQEDFATYSVREKNIPPKNKAVATQITDLQNQLHALEKNLLDVQQLIPIFEKEFTAIQKQMEDDKKAGKAIQTLELRHKSAVENKFNALRKSENEYINQHQELQLAINRAAQDLRGDDETQLILSKLNDLRKQISDRKDILIKFQAQSVQIQKEIASIEVEQKNLSIEIKNLEKKERLISSRVEQQSEQYAETERQLQALSAEKDRESLKFKEFIRQHDSLSKGFESIENELKSINENIETLMTKQEAAEKRLLEVSNSSLAASISDKSKAEASESPESTSASSSPAPRNQLLEFLQMPQSDASRSRANSASNENSPVLLPKAAAVLQAKPFTPLRVRSTPIVASVDCDFGEKHTHGLINISQYLLRYENAVPLHTLQHAEEGSRICIDVTDIIDLRWGEAPRSRRGSPNMRMRVLSVPMTSRDPTKASPVLSAAGFGSPARPAAFSLDQRAAAPSVSASQPPLAHAASLPTAVPVTSSSSSASASASSTSSSGFFGSLISSLGGALQSVATELSSNPSSTPAKQAAESSSSAAATSASSAPAPSAPAASASLSAHSHSPQSFTFDVRQSDPSIDVARELLPSHTHRKPFFDASTPLFTLTVVLRAGYRNRFLFNAEGESDSNVTMLKFIAPENTIQRMHRALKSSIHTARQSVIISPTASLLKPRGSVLLSSVASSASTVSESPREVEQSIPQQSTKENDEPASMTVAASESILLDAQAEEVRRREELARQEESEEVFVEGESEITSLYCLKKIIRATPDRYHLSVWKMVYSMTVHGVSFNQFLSIVQEYPGAILVFQDTSKKVFGGYASAPFLPTIASGGIYYGSGESFVFDIRDRENAIKSVFLHRWTGENDYFLFSGENFIAMGGGNAFAWQVDHSFKAGTSGVCSTFDSPVLSGSPNFSLLMFEVWAPARDQTSTDLLLMGL